MINSKQELLQKIETEQVSSFKETKKILKDNQKNLIKGGITLEEAAKKELCIKLKNFYNESESRVKTDAMVCMAYTDKISTESINFTTVYPS